MNRLTLIPKLALGPKFSTFMNAGNTLPRHQKSAIPSGPYRSVAHSKCLAQTVEKISSQVFIGNSSGSQEVLLLFLINHHETLICPSKMTGYIFISILNASTSMIISPSTPFLPFSPHPYCHKSDPTSFKPN